MNRDKRSAKEAALATIEQLRGAGHVALLAGGCVRDMLLERTPKDYDVATDARPERVLTLFPRARKVGAQFGVILTRRFGHDIEVATFRSDGMYSDGRRPDAVTFGSAEEDALRRDFTINGLFYDPIDEGVIDYVGGRSDIEARILRTIGDPALRFGEDHLRMLRAVRFAGALGFEIDTPTLQAIRAHAPRLAGISPERVWMELATMLEHTGRAVSWSLLVETGLCDHLIPDWQPDLGTHNFVERRLAFLPVEPLDPVVGLAAIVHDEPDDRVVHVVRALRLSNQQQGATRWLVQAVRRMRDTPDMALADLKTLMVRYEWDDSLALLRADLLARDANDEPLSTIVDRASQIASEDIAPPPLLTGDALKTLGLKPGQKFGVVMKTVYRAQLNEEIRTVKDARRLAETLVGTGG